MDRDAKLQQLKALRDEVNALESELEEEAPPRDWTPQTYYTTYHLLAGMVLGFIAAAASLLYNVVGAAVFGIHPLELIRVYLTFPLGEKALTMSEGNEGFLLAAGCCLYLGTGMIGGIPFHLMLSRFFENASIGKRFLAATVMGVGVWLINYYGLLSWLQPLLIGGSWILDEIPIFVAVTTHLVFAWTMLLIDQWGRFVPHPVQLKEMTT